VDRLYEQLKDIADQARKGPECVATAIKTIAASSAHSARKNLGEIDWARLSAIVAADVFGALNGVLLVVGKVPPPFLVPVAVVGAVAGSATGSFAAYYYTKK
jgi:hypothetical protein